MEDQHEAKKRKLKPLPEKLARMTDRNFELIQCALEVDPNDKDNKGEQNVATTVTFPPDVEGGSPVIYKIHSLTLDQIRKFCKLLGIKYVNNCTKFQCRRAIAVLLEYGQTLPNDGSPRRFNEDRRVNTIIRITNVVFSSKFVDRFLCINDAKNRADHEFRDMSKDFWRDCCDAYNDFENVDWDNAAFQIVIDPNNVHHDDLAVLDLNDAEIMTAEVMRKKVSDLFKIRKVVQKNMTQSGTHESDPYDFMEHAIRKSSVSRCPPLAAFYFFIRCDDNPEIDAATQDCLDIEMEGSTSESFIDSVVPRSTDRKRAYAAIAEISETTKRIAFEMKASVRVAEEAVRNVEATERRKQRIEIARALDDTEELRKIMKEIRDEQDAATSVPKVIDEANSSLTSHDNN